MPWPATSAPIWPPDPPAWICPPDRRLLSGDAGEPFAFRPSRRWRDGHVLSEAETWYVPTRLAAPMRAQLTGTDTPFGYVVRALGVIRETLTVEEPDCDGSTILTVTARLTTSKPIALVRERYQAALLFHT
jgi:hypothetical protein